MDSSRVVVHLDALADNIAVVHRVAPTTRVIFVVKSDAYGHGLEQVVRTALRCGVDCFAVAYLAEAERVRTVAPEADILLLGVIEAAEVAGALAIRAQPIVVCLEQARALSAAVGGGRRLQVHVKIDTGMGRLGFQHDGWAEVLPELARLEGLETVGICSHFATVDPSRPYLAAAQAERFREATAAAERVFGRLLRHVSSSRAFQFEPGWELDAVRLGIMLYGYGSRETGMRMPTDPLLEWKAKLVQVKPVPAGFPVGYYSAWRSTRPTDIGTVNVGYADGFLRSLSNTGRVLVGGKRRRVVGRVSMNYITIDLGPDSGQSVGDEVVLLGRQGEEAIQADEMARWADTIAYEILVAIRSDIGRSYSGA